MGSEIAWSHHEKWDGVLVPAQGLRGVEIPLSARSSRSRTGTTRATLRPYKPIWPTREAVDVIAFALGCHAYFDPDDGRLGGVPSLRGGGGGFDPRTLADEPGEMDGGRARGPP
jgi:hypothetical protein